MSRSRSVDVRDTVRFVRWALVFCVWLEANPARAAGFSYRKTYTIDRTKVGVSGTSTTTLSNYPMLYNLTDTNLKSTANGGHVNSTNGYDIIFRGLDTATCGGAAVCNLSHEMERYTATSGAVIAWVRVPSLNTNAASSNTVFYVYYGNASVTTSSERATDVWDSNFKGVWHLSEDPSGSAPQAKDSTLSLPRFGGRHRYEEDGVPWERESDGASRGSTRPRWSGWYTPAARASARWPRRWT